MAASNVQVVFVECPVVESWRPFCGRFHRVPEEGHLSSPRVNFMLDKTIAFENADVLYVHLQPSLDGVLRANEETLKYKRLYNFILECRPNASCRNRFYLGYREDERFSLDEILAQSEVYLPASGKQLPVSMPSGQLTIVRSLMFQGMHILHEWNKRGLLEKQKIRRTLSVAPTTQGVPSAGIIMETEASVGTHVVLRPDEGWLWNTSTPIVAMIIDYYRIESSFAGPNSQLNFAGDAEYRLMVATYLFDVLKAFVIANDGLAKVETVNDIIVGVGHIFSSHK